MESLSNNSSVMNSVQQRTATKRSKSKKRNNDNSINNNKHIKVVYISNPMKVKTSASEFRALVQELTGQDAKLPDPFKFQGSDSDIDGGGGGGNNNNNCYYQVDSDNFMVKVGDDEEDDDHETVMVVPPPPPMDPNSGINCEGQLGSSLENFGPFDGDDVFTSQMIENISSMLPASVFYESPQVDQLVMQCNYVHP